MNGQVPIEAIDDNEQIDQGSLMQRVYFKYKPYINSHEQQDQGDDWIANRNFHGMSEEQNSNEKEKISIEKTVKK